MTSRRRSNPSRDRSLARSLRGLAVALALATSGSAGASGPALDCLQDGILGSAMPWPDYAPSGVVLAPHCYGSNHQTVAPPQRVVFLGDSITVGTPPTPSDDYYRNRLADDLVSIYGLDAPSILWRLVDPGDGMSIDEESGDFANCARWGAKAEDLLGGDQQIPDCFPPNDLNKRTLVLMTIGGNDVASLAEDNASGVPLAQLIADRDAFVAEIDAALAWLKTPGRFPNGISVVLANVYDPSDGTGTLGGACSGSGSLVGIQHLVLEVQESLAQMSVAYDVDVVFARERFCGNGLNASDPDAPCYRGAAAEAYIDLTCIHPTPDGHDALTIDFLSTIVAVAPPPIPLLGGAWRGLLLAGCLLLLLRFTRARRPW